MTQLGVDYPWSKPTPAALRAAGVTFALRYLSTDQSKNLTRAEADQLAAQGIWSGVVWETTAGRALAGYTAGAADAKEALKQATACGMPSGRPIYFAVDTDTTWSQVQAYFQGVRSVLPLQQVGVYGGIRIVQGAADSGLVAWFWQTLAWSGGRWDPRAHIRQVGYITVGKVQCDKNLADLIDFGQWQPGRTPTTIFEEDPLAAFSEADLRRFVREEVMSQDVRDRLAFANWYWLVQALKGRTFEPGTGGWWEGFIAELTTALRPLSAPALEQIQAAVTAALADSTVRVHVDVTAPTNNP